MAGDSQHGTIRRKLIEFLEPALPGIEVEVGTAERWQRMCLRFRHPSFEELLPEQRFRQVLAAIPQDYHQQHLQGAVWFEMAPGETEDDLLKAPRSEDLADREAAIAGTLFACGFFEALSKAMGESPIESCTGRFVAGEAAEVMVETHVREDHIHLYGFIDAVERDWFRLLTTVQGVGAKVALGLLTVLSPDELVQAIAAADKAAVTQAPGVGPKLAARILNELKDKVGAIALAEVAAAGTWPGGPVSDAASALVNLGYQPTQALGAVSRAAVRLGEGADVEALIRGGLSEMAPVDARGSV